MCFNLLIILIASIFSFSNSLIRKDKPALHSKSLSGISMPMGRPMPGDGTLRRLIRLRGRSVKPADVNVRINPNFMARDAGALIIGEALVQKAPGHAVKWFRKAGSSRLHQVRIRSDFGLIRAFLLLGKPNLALKIIERLDNARLSENQQARLLFFRSKAVAGKSRALLKRLFIGFPTSRWGSAKITGLHESDLSDQELFDRAKGFSRALDHGEAARIYGLLHKKGVKTVQTARLLANILLYKLRTQPKRALRLLNEVGQARGISRDLLMAKAKAYKMLEKYAKAEQLYRVYLEHYPRGRYRMKCYYYMGWLPYDHGKYQQAVPLFDDFLRRYHHSPLRTYVLWFKAWSLIKTNQLVRAATTLKRMIPYGNNLVAGKAMYWLGVIAHRLKDLDSSRQWFETLIARYPMTYYSILAWKRMGQWYGQHGPAWLDARDVVGSTKPYWGLDRLHGVRRRVMLRVRALVLLGFRSEAFYVYKPHGRSIERLFHGHNAVRFLRTVYGMTGQWRLLSKIAARRFGRMLGPVPKKSTLDYWSLVYPRAENWFVRPYTKEEGIDPLWVYSIMRQESRFSLSKVSVADAIGIMQMIPETAKRVGRELNIPYNPVDFFKPWVNIRFCVHYLASLFRDFKDQIVFASAAYNGGAPPIRRMMLAHRNEPMDRMVEDISYNQSRNYCRKVAEHLLRYIRLYALPARRHRLIHLLYPAPVDYDLMKKVDY